MNKPIESFTIDEGVDAYGVRTLVHHHSDGAVKVRQFDANPLLESCAEERKATAGQKWGEMRKVGSIPMGKYVEFMAIKDNQERGKKIREWLRLNPAFITFDKYAK